MDRKGLLIIVVTLAIAYGINFFFLAPGREREMKEYRERRAKWEVDQQAKAEEAKKNATPQPADTAATQPPIEKPPEPPKPAAPEEKKNVASEVGTVNYIFTNHGGGISRVVLNEHLEDKKKGTKIVLNEFGAIPI